MKQKRVKKPERRAECRAGEDVNDPETERRTLRFQEPHLGSGLAFKYLRALYHGSRETTEPFIIIIHQERVQLKVQFQRMNSNVSRHSVSTWILAVDWTAILHHDGETLFLINAIWCQSCLSKSSPLSLIFIHAINNTLIQCNSDH